MSELWLRDTKVLTLKDVEGEPASITKVDTPELLPICLKRECTFEKFMDWLSKRGIPDIREGLAEMKKLFGEDWLENKNYASLTDHYWLKKRTESYKKVNFFTNIYSKDIGDMAFAPWLLNKKKYDNFSPDLTTNGILKKRWIQNPDMTSRLVKAGSYATHQEPLSEVLVSVLAEKFNKFSCVKYDLYIEGATMCSVCDNFVTKDTALVPAYYVYYHEDRPENESIMTHLFKMCEKFDIPGAEEHIKWVLFVDSLTGNEDRNLGNIGFLLDINTNKFIGPAPMYDSGNAYWSSGSINNPVKSKMFSDIEIKNFKEMKRKSGLEFLTEDKNYIEGYKKLIRSYPCITDIKKEKLIEAIERRNIRLCKIKQPELDR